MRLLEPQEAHRVEQTEGKQRPSDSRIHVGYLGALLSASAPEGLGQGSASKLPGEAGANQWGTLGVVSCRFIAQARTKGSFLNQWLEPALPPTALGMAGSNPGEAHLFLASEGPWHED